MAIANTAHGNTKTSSTASTTSGAITTTAAVGETIIVAVGTVDTTSNAPTDTQSNSYVALGNFATNTERITLWGCLSNKGSSPSITCTFGNSRYGIAIATYTGVQGFNQSNTTTNTGSASPATATLPSSLTAGSWSLAGFANKGTATWSASTGNLRNHIAGASNTTPGAAIVDNTTTTCAAAESGSNVWAGTIIELLSVSPISGGLTGLGSVSTTLKGAGAMVANATGVATASDTLVGTGALVASPLGAGAVSGTLTNNATGSSAAINATTSLSALLTAKGVLAGSSLGSAVVVATLKGTGRLLASPIAAASVLAAMQGTGAVGAHITAQALVSGALTDISGGGGGPTPRHDSTRHLTRNSCLSRLAF